MLTIACYNIKGGVGKTATAINLAHIAALEGHRVLLWDLDPQGATSFYLNVKNRVKGGGGNLLRKKQELGDFTKKTAYKNLRVVPSDFSYRNLDLLLDKTNHPTRRLNKRINSLGDNYDYLFIDCPPGISLVSENVFEASRILLVPTIPTPLSLHTLSQLTDFCEAGTMHQMRILPFFSMVDKRKKLHRETVATPPAHLPQPLKTSIPYASDIEKMGIMQAPVGAFSPASTATKAYQALWNEIHAELLAYGAD